MSFLDEVKRVVRMESTADEKAAIEKEIEAWLESKRADYVSNQCALLKSEILEKAKGKILKSKKIEGTYTLKRIHCVVPPELLEKAKRAEIPISPYGAVACKEGKTILGNKKYTYFVPMHTRKAVEEIRDAMRKEGVAVWRAYFRCSADDLPCRNEYELHQKVKSQEYAGSYIELKYFIRL